VLSNRKREEWAFQYFSNGQKAKLSLLIIHTKFSFYATPLLTLISMTNPQKRINMYDQGEENCRLHREVPLSQILSH
jgi:hypothetical protein